MDPDVLKTVGAVAGLGGIAIALATYVFRDVVEKNIFPSLTKHQAFSLLRLIVILSSLLAISGVIAYVYVTISTSEDLSSRLAREARDALRVADEDRHPYKNFLEQGNSTIFRIHPRGASPYLETEIEGGGAYYSFLRQTNEYGYGNELGYENGRFETGFAGLDYGYILALGDTPIEKVSSADETPPDWLPNLQHDAWKYVWTYRPPTEVKELREHQDNARGLNLGATSVSERAPAFENTSYLLRAISPEDHDVLIAFYTHRRLEDNSYIIVGKIVNTFPIPVIIGTDG